MLLQYCYHELQYMLIASGYSGQLKYMNMYDAMNLFSHGIRVDVKYYVDIFKN